MIEWAVSDVACPHCKKVRLNASIMEDPIGRKRCYVYCYECNWEINFVDIIKGEILSDKDLQSTVDQVRYHIEDINRGNVCENCIYKNRYDDTCTQVVCKYFTRLKSDGFLITGSYWGRDQSDRPPSQNYNGRSYRHLSIDGVEDIYHPTDEEIEWVRDDTDHSLDLEGRVNADLVETDFTEWSFAAPPPPPDDIVNGITYDLLSGAMPNIRPPRVVTPETLREVLREGNTNEETDDHSGRT